MHSTVTCHSFATSTDQELIVAAQKLVAAMPQGPARKRAARGVLCRKPDVMRAGKLLWASLTSGGNKGQSV